MEDKILIIEDDEKISRLIEMELKFEGYETEKAYDGRDGLEKALKKDCVLVLLDLMLPKMNGIEVCKRIREVSQVPIIILTAKDEVTDKVIGLDYGADDYMTKPFSNEELIARIKALLRRVNHVSKPDVFVYEDLKIDYKTYEVYRGDKLISLSKKEFELLDYLVLNKGIVLSRNKILEEVWGYDYVGNDNILDLYIKYVRDKIDKNYDRKFIQTIRGVAVSYTHLTLPTTERV